MWPFIVVAVFLLTVYQQSKGSSERFWRAHYIEDKPFLEWPSTGSRVMPDEWQYAKDDQVASAFKYLEAKDALKSTVGTIQKQQQTMLDLQRDFTRFGSAQADIKKGLDTTVQLKDDQRTLATVLRHYGNSSMFDVQDLEQDVSAIQKLLKIEPDRAMQEAKEKRFQDDHTLLNISFHDKELHHTFS